MNSGFWIIKRYEVYYNQDGARIVNVLIFSLRVDTRGRMVEEERH